MPRPTTRLGLFFLTTTTTFSIPFHPQFNFTHILITFDNETTLFWAFFACSGIIPHLQKGVPALYGSGLWAKGPGVADEVGPAGILWVPGPQSWGGLGGQVLGPGPGPGRGWLDGVFFFFSRVCVGGCM